MSLSQLFSILQARWGIIAKFVGALLLLAIAINVLLPNKYTATATVLVNINSTDPVEGYGPNVAGMGLASSYMSTQVDIINSEQVARRVTRLMRLTDNPTMREQWQRDTKGRGNFESWAAKSLQKSLDVRPTRDSNVVNVNYSSVDPRFSEAMANAFANAYIETSIELKTSPAKQYTAFFEARAKQLKESLEAAQTKLSVFQKEKGLVGADERMDVEMSRLNSLAANLVAAQGYSAESKGRQQAATTSGADKLQDVLNNPVIGALKTDLSRQEARLNELSSKLGDAHPDVIQLRANISEIRKKIEQETSRVSTGTNVSNDINKSREGEISAAYEAQRQKLLKLKEDRDTAAIMTKDVEAAQRAYDAVQARLSQSNLSSQTNQTNVTLLTPAVEPDSPTSPMQIVNIVIAIVLGLLLGAGGAVAKEFADPRVRSLSDVAQNMNLPVLGMMPASADVVAKRKYWWSRKNSKQDTRAANLIGSNARQALPVK